MGEIAASAVKFFSLLPVELTAEEGPVLAQRPATDLSTEGVDLKQHLLDIGRKRMLTVYHQVGKRVVSVFPFTLLPLV
ncbi:MAG TPA: hypothetical protein VM848_12665 [Acidimicrobiia bacterium]|nr:hypothetical protein [Acidimicrobiia bacterium]